MTEELDLLDWRRRVFALYAEVRARAPREAHERWREVRDDLFGSHPQSPFDPPERAAFAGLRYFDYDPRFRVTAPVLPRPADRFEIQTSTGDQLAMRRFGAVELEWGTLDVFWIDVYGGGVFVPLLDATSGRSTYGGGRYLLDTVKGADLGSAERGELVLDLNFAYNPSCHYSPRWSCPLASRDSRLPVAIEAGERSYYEAERRSSTTYE